MRLKLTIKQSFIAAIALALLVFFTIIGIYLRQSRYEKNSVLLISNTHDLLFHTERMALTATEIETNSRAFLLTDQLQFKEAYQKAKGEIPEQSAKLKDFVSDRPGQQILLDSLLFYVNRRITFSDSVIRLKNKLSIQDAVQLVATGGTKLYSDNIRRVVAKMQQQENILLQERKKNNRKETAVEQVIFLVITLLILVLLIILFWKERNWVLQKEQKNAEEHFRLLANSIKDYAIFMLDKNGIVTSWSSGAEYIKGYQKTEVVGKSSAIFYTPEDIKNDEPANNLKMAMQYGRYETEGWRLKKDGTPFWANVVFTALKDEAGNLYGYSKITRNITEKRKAQEELEFLLRQINQSNDAIYTLDAHRKIKSWNLGAEKLYGFKSAEVLNKEPNVILKTDVTNEEINNALKQIAEKDYWTGELQRITKNGELVYVRSSSTTVRNNTGNVTGYVSVSFDITLQKKLQQEINHLANMVEQSSEAIISIGLDSNIISWNNGAEKLHGYSKAEAIGKTAVALQLIQLSETEIAADIEELFQKGFWKKEMYFFHKDGSSFFGIITANLIKNEQGEITAFFFIVKDISIRKQLEEQLKKYNEELEQKVKERTEVIEMSEKRYRYLFENNPMPMWVIDLTTFNFLDVNEMAIVQYGYSRDEFLKMTAMDIRPPEDKEAFIKADHSFEINPADYNRGVWKHRKKDGTVILVEIIAHEIIYEGIPARIILANDVTAKKIAEEKLASSESRFRALVEKNKDVIMLLDENFKVTYRSPSATEVNGWTDEDVKTMSGIQNIHPDDMLYARAVIGDMLANPGKPVDIIFRNRHKNGHFRWLEGVVTNLLFDKNVNAILINFRDVTERIEADEKLKASEEQFRHSMENMLEGVQIIGFDWRYIYVNDSMAKHSKYLKEELIGYTVMEKYPGIEQAEIFKTYEKCFNERVPVHLENEFIFPDKSQAWFELSFLPVPEGIFILSIDITERKLAEEAIKKLNTYLEERVNKRTEELKKANEELESFSYSVSHDLRAPLRAIIGFSAILEEDYSNKLDDEARRITTVIKSNTTKMGNLIDDLLTFSRMGRHEIVKTVVNSIEIVDEIIKGLDSKIADNIEWAIHPLPAVKSDINMLRQVWVNLISNAVKYSGNSPSPKIQIGSFKYNAQTVFFVEDNGVGFDEKYKNKLFKVFQRLHSAEEFEGTGIGLAIVEKIIAKHGGYVWAEAELNKGASFYFSLPEN
ncbi:PAS domain S-box protein [Ferruginibacter sp.]|nr:PAS domain S-box protein [Ferruginibacter sp.]